VAESPADKDAYRTPRAYWLGVFNGIMFTIGVAFVDPATVLPAFVSELTDSGVAVGAVSAIGMGGWYLPQLVAANYAQPRRYKRPLYMLAVYFRGGGWVIAIPAVYFLARSHPALALAGFFLGYSFFVLGGGLGGIAFLDIVAKTIKGRQLGSFFGHRQVWGALGGVGAGLLVKEVLGGEGIPFPQDYALLMVLALACFIPGWAAFASIKEPPGEPGESQPLSSFLTGAVPAKVLREDRAFRLLVMSRLLTGAASLALPFYIVYCRRVLHMSDEMVGVYLSVQMAGMMLLVPVWSVLNDRRGARTLLTVIAALAVATPALALLGSLFPEHAWFNRLAFGAVFFSLVSLAAVGRGGFTGATNYLFAIAPEPKRPLYIGVLNTLFAVTAFLPLPAGLLVKAGMFEALFAMGTLLGLGGLVVTLALPPVDVE